MAKRPTHAKKMRRLRKALNRQTPIAFIDLVDWLKTRGHAQTTGEARELLVDGKVRVGSHAVGRQKALVSTPISALAELRGDKPPEPVEKWVPAQLVRAEFRPDLIVQK